ncbi:hypothetical protein M404DRAFT_31507 [Pisolithus tinctorius Marx 270]|uniref:Uncharacterized protein n=1 Tax=Pisolithus tinctorius Marx 270 TaxID=870435 RepID=A0A0C3JLC4_PISTI|nr:hypothetical protein M404DRAFT_31507 [Pisolithus tinctorius Marx 270]
MTSPLAHRSVEPVRTLGGAQGHIDNASDVPSKAVVQLVHELGSMLQGCAPDPPVVTGVDSIAHAESDEFVKLWLPTRSNVSLVPTSVLLDQNRWPAWMCNEPKVNTKNEDNLSPKMVWSELVENDEELRRTVLQWFGNSTVLSDNDQPGSMKHGQPTSDTSAPRLTTEVKGKWRALARSEASEECPVNGNSQHHISEQEEQDENMKYLVLKLKEAGLIKQLDSAEALICKQQTIIESFKQCTKHKSMNPGPLGLSVEQKEHVPQMAKNIGTGEPDNKDTTKYNFTDSTKLAKRSESPEIIIDGKAHPSSVFPRESTILRAMCGDSGDDSDSSDLDSMAKQHRKLTEHYHQRAIAPSDPSNSSSNDSDSSSEGDSSFGSDFFGEEPSTIGTNDSEREKVWKHEKKRRYRTKLNKLKYQQAFLKEDPPFTYRGEVQVGLFKKWCCELHNWVKHT